MVYIDTSVLLALFLNEAKTADAWCWVNRQPPGAIALSDWTLTELSSAMGVKRRMNAIDDAMHGKVLAAARQFAQLQLAMIAPDHADFHRAAALCEQWGLGLRAGDALHVVIAERRGMVICTLDRVMREAAERLGIAVETP